MDPKQVGIYFNAKEKSVVRITSPYWIPEAPDWVLVTNDPNATLAAVRDTLKKKRAWAASAASVTWGRLPVRE